MQVDRGFPRGSPVKKICLQSRRRRRLRRPGFDPWVRKVPWRSAEKHSSILARWTTVHGGPKESDRTEATEHTHMR